MKNTTWGLIKTGDIVEFRYRGIKDIRTSKRTVLILSPRYVYKKQSTRRNVQFVIGLELANDNTKSVGLAPMKRLLESVQAVFSPKQEDKSLTDEGLIKRYYRDIKRFLDKAPLFRTYFLRECRKRRVFLIDKLGDIEDLQLKKVIDMFIEETGGKAWLSYLEPESQEKLRKSIAKSSRARAEKILQRTQSKNIAEKVKAIKAI